MNDLKHHSTFLLQSNIFSKFWCFKSHCKFFFIRVQSFSKANSDSFSSLVVAFGEGCVPGVPYCIIFGDWSILILEILSPASYECYLQSKDWSSPRISKQFFRGGRGDWLEKQTRDLFFKPCLQSALHKFEKTPFFNIMDTWELMEIMWQGIKSFPCLSVLWK